MSLRPWYNQEANYQTNAKSFMDYLARTNKFLEVLIEDYEIFQELVIEELERMKFDSEMAVDDILNKWLDDGTLARIINDGVLEYKADKAWAIDQLTQLREDVQNDLKDTTDDVDLKMNQLMTDVINLNNETMNMIDNVYKSITPDMTTAEIQAALNNGGSFKFYNGEYVIDLTDDNGKGIGLDIQSYTDIILDGGVILKINPSSYTDYRILNIEKKEHIKISGGQIIGDKHSHLGDSGEWGHGISIRGSKNIIIEDLKVTECWGDGIYIGQSTDYTVNNCQDITINNILADDNRRQGISVTAVINLYMSNLKLINTSGTPPSAGIDFEPNNNRNELTNVVVNGIYTENNTVGIDVHIANALGSIEKEISLTINDHVSLNDGVGMGCRMPTSEDSYLMNGRVVTNNPLWKNSKTNGLHATWVSNKDITLLVNNPKIFNPNMNGSSGLASGSAIRLGNRESEIPIGNVIIDRLDLTHPDSNPTYPLVIEGQSIKNVMFLDPISVGDFYAIRTQYGSFTITDAKRVLKDETPSLETNIGVNYSSIYSSINVPSTKIYYLDGDIEPGSSDIEFIAENGKISIVPDEHSRIAPLGTVGQRLVLEPFSSVTLRRLNQTVWQIVNIVGDSTVS